MRFRNFAAGSRFLTSLCGAAVLHALFVFAATAQSDASDSVDPPGVVIAPSFSDLARQGLVVIENDGGTSQVTSLNCRRHAVILKDVRTKIGFEQQSLFWNGTEEVSLPAAPTELGFSHFFSEALSDNDLVVGYASRGLGDRRGATEGAVWDMRRRQFVPLGRLKGHLGSHAFDISRDGRVIVGYSVGPEPPTMVPVVWTSDGDSWAIERLSTIHDNNPCLQSSRVVVSPNGSQVVACLTKTTLPGRPAQAATHVTCLWRRAAAGDWRRSELFDRAFRLTGINNGGTLAVSMRSGRQRRSFVATSDGALTEIKPLDSDDTMEVTDINEDGTVVGFSDNLNAADGVPRAIVWREGQVTRLQIPGDPVSSVAYGINDQGDIAGSATFDVSLVQSSPEDSKSKSKGGGQPAARSGRTVSFVLRLKGFCGSDH